MKLSAVTYELIDGVAIITLNRPDELNTWNPQLSDDLAVSMGQADADDDVRVVVVTGAGRAFCAGADLSGGESGFEAGGVTGQPDLPRKWPHEVRKPVIAAINGHAIGVGITYPMLCDFRIAADGAKIQFAMVRRGIVPELGAHFTVTRALGYEKAAELMMFGKMISGSEAASLGLVSEALPAGEVLPRAMDIARDVSTNVAPVSAAIVKKLMWESLTSSHEDIMKKEQDFFPRLITSADAKEGVQSFLEKRDPQWTLSVSRDLDHIMGSRNG
jgi:enoyl-CoA hydratase/carnithine racemase